MVLQSDGNNGINPFFKKGLNLKIDYLKPMEASERETQPNLFGPFNSINQVIEEKGTNLENTNPNQEIKIEKNEDEMTTSQTIIDKKTGKPIQKTVFSMFGEKTQVIEFGEETDTITDYLPDKSYVINYFDSKTKMPVESNKFDNKNRLEMNTVYAAGMGTILVSKEFNPETGDIISKEEFSKDNPPLLLKIISTNGKYPDWSLENEYNADKKLIKTTMFDENKKNRYSNIYSPENEFEPIETIYYDKNGNITHQNEYVNGKEINHLATDIFNGNTQNITDKINKDNIFDIIKTFSLKSPDKKMIATIMDNTNIQNKEELIKHIASTTNEALRDSGNNAIEYYSGNEKLVNKSIKLIEKKLNKELKNITNDNAESIDDTLKMMHDMAINSDYYRDKANGKIDKTAFQGNTADCWLLAGVNGISSTGANQENPKPIGQKYLQSLYKRNKKTGDLTIELMGGKEKYTITPKDIQASSNLSKGDADVRALEIALQKYFKEHKPDGKETIDGNWSSKFFEILTGNNAKDAYINNGQLYIMPETSIPDLNSEPMQAPTSKVHAMQMQPAQFPIMQNPKSENIEDYKLIPLKILCMNNETIDYLETKQKNLAMTCSARVNEFDSHAYTINKIEGDNIYISEPNSAVEIQKYTREEFQNRFLGLIELLYIPDKL